MLSEKRRAVSDKATPKNNRQRESYLNSTPGSSRINELLTALLFSLQDPDHTSEERALALDAIDKLVRLKVDLGLIRRMRRAS